MKSGSFCQDCKSILLPYFENTQDWQMAYEMESLQRSFVRNNNIEHDLTEYTY